MCTSSEILGNRVLLVEGVKTFLETVLLVVTYLTSALVNCLIGILLPRFLSGNF